MTSILNGNVITAEPDNTDVNTQHKETDLAMENIKEDTEKKEAKDGAVQKEISTDTQNKLGTPAHHADLLNADKEKENVQLTVGTQNRMNKKITGPSKKQLCVADVIGKDFNLAHSSTTHNDTYSRNWVSTNYFGKNAQTDSITEQDTCDSNLLVNVTSVSKCAKPKLPKSQLQQ